MEALGSALFGQKACGQCHTIKGNPSANGKVGPDLTHIGSRKTILTFMKNTSQNLHRWIDHPQLLKKGAHMPSFRFKTKQINAVVAYLEGLK
jgi:cytochrome c oxidase subunit 2